ncbi:MAG: MogA/MoaB family molybdenum cofactor biosynthesis protein [Gemmatimonadetes bacterium]|nr:MogA/MoaB family molybdenum cofactor biosynthesis protein [Gemmatimonadota bacterium]NNK47907.1 MogA/MoaB family molybdenum cofactor biosynthesis protein [Gemmatimonadota bacterium]
MSEQSTLRVAVLTVSDGVAAGVREDASGELIEDWVRQRGYQVSERTLVPDETGPIANALIRLCDEGTCDLLLTTGGTGLTPRDVTPEATQAVLERTAPGIAEAIRLEGLRNTPRAALGRGVAGVRGSTLVVNLPGSPGGVSDGLGVLAVFVDHAVDLVRGRFTSHD